MRLPMALLGCLQSLHTWTADVSGFQSTCPDGRAAAGSPECQTLFSELPNIETIASNFQSKTSFKPSIHVLAFLHCQLPTCLRPLASGTRPAAQTAKRCFLNCLETSFKPASNLPLSHFHLPLVPLVPSSLTRSPCCRQGSADIYIYIYIYIYIHI